MLEAIRTVLEEAKAKIESIRDNEVSVQIIKATQQFIAPKVEEIEAKKQAELAIIKNEYDAKVKAITEKYEAEKESEATKVKEATTKAVNDCCEAEIANLATRLAH